MGLRLVLLIITTTSDYPKTVFSLDNLMSQVIASSIPPSKAKPLIAAIIGKGNSN